MRLIVQSDDYGISRAASLGIVEAIKNGIVRNTGFFTNMPWSKECYEWIKPYVDDIAFGIDFNLSTGSPILTKNEVPSLIHESGRFYTSKENRALDEDAPDHDHVVYEDAIKECKAQLERFVEITGRKPDYVHPHAYTTKTTMQVLRDIAAELGVPFTEDVIKERLGCFGAEMMGWYKFPPTLDNQADSSLEQFILDGKIMHNDDLAILIGHCGYVDRELMNLSSFNIYRLNDLYGCTSEKVKQYLKDNNYELITWREIK